VCYFANEIVGGGLLARQEQERGGRGEVAENLARPVAPRRC